MEKKRLSIILSICLILAFNIASAGNVEVDRAQIGRLTGDDVNELIENYNQDEYNLQHSTFISSGIAYPIVEDTTENKVDMLDGFFGTFFNPHFIDLVGAESRFSMPLAATFFDWKKNELLIMEPDFFIFDELFTRATPLKALVPQFKPFMVYSSNADYSASVAEEENLISLYDQDALIYASSNKRSEEFVKSFVCNLGIHSGREVPELLLEAKNNYLLAADETLKTTTKLSYHLYGNPMSTYSVLNPYPYYEKVSQPCEQGHPTVFDPLNSFYCNTNQGSVTDHNPLLDEPYHHLLGLELKECKKYVDNSKVIKSEHYESQHDTAVEAMLNAHEEIMQSGIYDNII